MKKYLTFCIGLSLSFTASAGVCPPEAISCDPMAEAQEQLDQQRDRVDAASESNEQLADDLNAKRNIPQGNAERLGSTYHREPGQLTP